MKLCFIHNKLEHEKGYILQDSYDKRSFLIVQKYGKSISALFGDVESLMNENENNK